MKEDLPPRDDGRAYTELEVCGLHTLELAHRRV